MAMVREGDKNLFFFLLVCQVRSSAGESGGWRTADSRTHQRFLRIGGERQEGPQNRSRQAGPATVNGSCGLCWELGAGSLAAPGQFLF